MSLSFPATLSTERLFIRAPEPDDYPAINAAVNETWEQLYQRMEWAVERPSMEESRQRCLKASQWDAEATDWQFYCFEKASGEFALAMGARLINPNVPSFDIGYWCRAGFQGKGLVTEAANKLTEICFEVTGAYRVTISCDIHNGPSRAVAERCGFHLEGELVNDQRDKWGKLRTTALYARTRPE